VHFKKNDTTTNNILQNRIQRFKNFNKITKEKRDIIKNCTGIMLL